MPTFDLFRRSALCLAATSAFMPGLSFAAPPEFKFPSIDGGDIDLPGWRSGPVLVVSTASLCGYVDQFNGLQELHDRYAGQGTNVLAVPSDDFSQEQNLAEAVKSFCATTFDLTLPMTDIRHVGGG